MSVRDLTQRITRPVDVDVDDDQQQPPTHRQHMHRLNMTIDFCFKDFFLFVFSLAFFVLLLRIRCRNKKPVRKKLHHLFTRMQQLLISILVLKAGCVFFSFDQIGFTFDGWKDFERSLIISR